MSDPLQPHEQQHTRPPCPSLSTRVCPSSCSLHWWCHPAISSSDALFSFCPWSFPASGTFPMSRQSSTLIRWPKYWSFSFSISPSSEYSGFISLKIWCFWTVMLEKTLESPLDGKIKPVNPEGNQPWIFIGRTDVKLKLQYFSHLMRRTNSLEKTLMLGKIEGRRRTGWQRIKWLNDTTNSMEMSLRKLREIVKDREVWGAAVHRVAKGRTWTWLRD